MNIKETIGQRLSPILQEIEDTLIDHAAHVGSKPEFTDEGFRSGLQIFTSVMLDKLYEVQLKEGKSIDEASKQAELMGYEIRALILKYTKIDTLDLYRDINTIK